jgi:hypothetical protein
MIFKDNLHSAAYEEFIKKENCKGDPYRESLFYLLALNEDTRRNINLLYDFKSKGIITEGINEPFQTGTSIRVTRLAFNLFNNYHDAEEPARYTPEDIFYVFKSDLIYAMEAIKIRFEW